MLDRELLTQLVMESRDHLQSIEPDLLELELRKNEVSDELINRIFRAVHSVKGGFGFFGFKNITNLSHSMENVMSRVRDHQISVTSDMVDTLLLGIDQLRVMLDDVENSDGVDSATVIKKLEPYMQSDVNKDTCTLQSKIPVIRIDRDFIHLYKQLTIDKLIDLHKHGKRLYLIQIAADINNVDTLTTLYENWNKLGEIIDRVSSSVGKQNNAQHNIVFSTVLEDDLLLSALNFSAEATYSLDVSDMLTPEVIIQTVATDPKKKSTENRTVDDSLRVKVNLLNTLMNLAGELVLGRNQLTQQFNRKLIDALNSDRITEAFERDIEFSFKSIFESCQRNNQQLPAIVASETLRLKAALHQFLSFRIKEISGFGVTLQAINSVTSLLQENIMQTRLQPVSVVFSKFPRIVRDLAKKLGKQVDLELAGQEVELDKSIVELLSDPLTHLIRNSVDHGIELPQAREASGKPFSGKILLEAFHEGGKVIVRIHDDGQGINLETVKEIALKKGLISTDMLSTMSQREIQLIILQPGFSTAREISDVSGRGVGMDVVKSNIEKLGGSVDIESKFGEGTTITLTLPLTLAIIPSLIVSSEGRIFAIPQVSVEELVRIRSFEVAKKIERIQNSEVIRLRGKLLPLVRLSYVLEIPPTYIDSTDGTRKEDRRIRWSDRRSSQNQDTKDIENENRNDSDSTRRTNISNAVKIVVLKIGPYRFGLVVDAVFDSEEIVVKPLPEFLKLSQCYAGSTIMGDGRVAMILDPGGISNKAGFKFSDFDNHTKNELEEKSQLPISATQEILLFNLGAEESFGIYLNSISRIEKISNDEIERVGGKEFIKRDQNSLPLIRLEQYLPVSSPTAQQSHFYVLYPKSSHKKLGIVADEVHDVIKTEVAMDHQTIQGSGILGSSIINNRLTIIVDLPTLLQLAKERI